MIEVEVTASNMRGIRTEAFEFAFAVQNARIGDLVDLFETSYKIPFPMIERFKAEVRARNWNWIEAVDVNGEEQDLDEDDDFDDDDVQDDVD